jgi:hypothetical protein
MPGPVVAWLRLGDLSLALAVRHVFGIAHDSDPIGPGIDLARHFELELAEADQERRLVTVGLAGQRFWLRAGRDVALISAAGVTSRRLPVLVAPHLRRLGVASLWIRGGEIAFALDLARLRLECGACAAKSS